MGTPISQDFRRVITGVALAQLKHRLFSEGAKPGRCQTLPLWYQLVRLFPGGISDLKTPCIDVAS